MKNWCLKLFTLTILVYSGGWYCLCDKSQISSQKNDKPLEISSRTNINENSNDNFLSTKQNADIIQTSSDQQSDIKTITSNKVSNTDQTETQKIEIISNSDTEKAIHNVKPSVDTKIKSDDTTQTSSQVKQETDSVTKSINIDLKVQEKNERKEEKKEKTEEINDKSEEQSDKSDSVAIPDVSVQHDKQSSDEITTQTNDSNLEKQEKSAQTENILKTPNSEVMPSFDEWKKMMLAEQEKDGQKVQPLASVNGKKIISHKRRHNYASYECGAKIVSVNSEAEGTNHILNEMVDEYMLNPCKAKIWFVIELCESIQVSQIELANFELFSSSPKEFSVSWSDRFPTRDWTSLGTILVEDQRSLQSFNLQHKGYGKFIKLELLSHYGTEHYCPISVVRVFGTSMVDEYEEMEIADTSHHLPDEEEDRLDILTTTEEASSSQDIFGTARDAVMNIVKKAAQVLSRDHPSDVNESQTLSDLLDTKALQTDCERYLNCTDTNLTMKDKIILPVSSSSFIPYLAYCKSCSLHVDRYQSHIGSTSMCHFLFALFGPLVFESFCKQQKIQEKTDYEQEEIIPLPTSIIETSTLVQESQITSLDSIISDNKETDSLHSIETMSDSSVHSYISLDKSMLSLSESSSQENIPNLQNAIQPTKTIRTVSKEVQIKSEESSEILDKSISDKVLVEDIITVKTLTSSKDITTSDKLKTLEQESSLEKLQTSIEETEIKSTSTLGTEDITETTTSTTAETQEISISSTTVSQQISPTVIVASQDIEITKDEIEKYENAYQGGIPSKSEPNFVGIPSPPGQKESVFMRMANRIKALELNMSLSSQYLQELSQRYRRQMEDMQKAFNRTIGTLNDTARKAAIRDLHQQEIISQLQTQVTNLTSAVDLLLHERQSTHRQMLETHLCLMVIEAIIMITILSLCVRRMTLTLNHPPNIPTQSSLSVPSSECSYSPHRRKRSASDVQSSESSTNFLIVQPSVPIIVEPPPKVKKKHHKNKKKNQSKNSQQATDSCNINYFSSLTTCDTSDDTSLDKKLSLLSCKDSVNCENNFNIVHDLPKTTNRDRTGAVPLQNLTNGLVCYSAPPNKHNFKKIFKLQKKNSI